MGEIDDDALAGLVDEDPDHAMSLLAQMRGATDQKLAALAARLGHVEHKPTESPATSTSTQASTASSTHGPLVSSSMRAISGFGTGPSRRPRSRSSSIAAAR